MVDVKDVVRLDFENEINDLIELKNNGLLTDEKMDDSYNFMLEQLDTHYRQKDANDWTLDLIDVTNIVNIIQNTDYDLIERYGEIVKYLFE